MSDVSTKNILQQYIPAILEDDALFKQFATYILEQYYFTANEDHLRKKLHIFVKESYRTDSVALAQRLIKGENLDGDRDKVNWIWLCSQKIAFIVQYIVKTYPIGNNSE